MNLNQLDYFEKDLKIEKIIPNEESNCYTPQVFSDVQSQENLLLSSTYVNQFTMCDSSVAENSTKTVAFVDHLIKGPVNLNRNCGIQL